MAGRISDWTTSRQWIAGNLGLALGLPIAPFEIVEVPEELIELGTGLDLSELGQGPAFGSQRREVMELTASAVFEVPEPLQQDVLAFDWWIRNGDPLLTERGGNPNLFWAPETQELVVIDHNQAFDSQFDPGDFLVYHVFSGQRYKVFEDMVRRQEYRQRFSAALDGWPRICQDLPEAWLFADKERTLPVDFDLNAAHALLKRYEQDDFWDQP